LTSQAGLSEVTGPQSETGGRRADIQGLRAIAVLVVVFYHAGLHVPGGFVGVDIFFVISGYVITAMLWREWQQTGRIKMGRFYSRRFKRLTPALALMISVTVLISTFLASPLGPQQTAGQTAIGAMFLIANLVIATTTGGYFGTAAELNPLLHTWSLSVEEQFYLVFPALLAISWVISRRYSWSALPFLIVGSVASLSFALALIGPLGNSPVLRLALGFYSPLTRAWEFAVGALLALAFSKWNFQSGHLAKLLGLAGLALVALSLFLISSRTPFPGIWTLMPVVGTLLLLYSGAYPHTYTYRLLSSSPMVKIGDWSYSIYLWHWPFIVFAGLAWGRNSLAMAAAAAISFIPAILSYRFVEQPFRTIPFSGLQATRVTAFVVVPPLLLGGALWFGAHSGWWSQSVNRFQVSIIPQHVAQTEECDERRPMGSSRMAHCTWNKSALGQPVYVVGDSHAGHFSEGLIQAGKDLDRPVAIATAYSCPFVDLRFRDTNSTRDTSECQNYVEGTLDYLAYAPPGLVVIANADRYWLDPSYEAGETAQMMSNQQDRKLEALTSGLVRTVDSLTKAGHGVLLVQTVPRWDEWNPGRCNLATIVRGQCTREVPLDVATAHTKSVRSALDKVARAAKVDIFDPLVSLCPTEVCSTEAPTFTRYKDTSHISVPQSIDLAPDFQRVISGAP
jgi:peptidoglycan/LPS O-acetylase OafA/YrhL